MCAMFKEVRSNSAKNSISASDSSLAENPIKAWAIHTHTLNRRGRLWTPGAIHERFCPQRAPGWPSR